MASIMDHLVAALAASETNVSCEYNLPQILSND
jgi:transposase